MNVKRRLNIFSRCQLIPLPNAKNVKRIDYKDKNIDNSEKKDNTIKKVEKSNKEKKEVGSE